MLVLIFFIIVGYFSLVIIPDKSVLANSHFKKFDFQTILSVLLYSIFQTALAEEILFRGFIAKRLMHKFNFITANLIQAALFGLLHGVMISTYNVAIPVVLIAIVLPGAIAFSIFYINEKLANGSIVPGIIIHAIANISSTLMLMFHLV